MNNKIRFFCCAMLLVLCSIRSGLMMEEGADRSYTEDHQAEILVTHHEVTLDLSKIEVFKHQVQALPNDDALKQLCLASCAFTDLHSHLRHEMFKNPQEYVLTKTDIGKVYKRNLDASKDQNISPELREAREWVVKTSKPDFENEIAAIKQTYENLRRRITQHGGVYPYPLIGFTLLLLYQTPTYFDPRQPGFNGQYLSTFSGPDKGVYFDLMKKTHLLKTDAYIRDPFFTFARKQLERFIQNNRDAAQHGVTIVIGEGRNSFGAATSAEINPYQLIGIKDRDNCPFVDLSPILTPDIIADINDEGLHNALRKYVHAEQLKINKIVNETNESYPALFTEETIQCFFEILTPNGTIETKHEKDEDLRLIHIGFTHDAISDTYRKPTPRLPDPEVAE